MLAKKVRTDPDADPDACRHREAVKKLPMRASPSPPVEERVGERRPFSAANLNFFTASDPLQSAIPHFRISVN